MEFLPSKAVVQRLTENERLRSIGMLLNGSIQLNVARHFDLSQSVISRLWTRHRQIGNVTDVPHSGCPRFTSQRQDHQPVTHVLRDRTQSAI